MCHLSGVRRKRQSIGQRRAPVAEVLTMDPLDDLPRTGRLWPASPDHLMPLAAGCCTATRLTSHDPTHPSEGHVLLLKDKVLQITCFDRLGVPKFS
jgi:hypothetical protein